MTAVYDLSLPRLALSFLPVFVVIWVAHRWQLSFRHYLYATARMVVQLLVVGSVLLIIFNNENILTVMAALIVMFTMAAWIALGPLKEKRRQFYGPALLALVVGGGLVLALIVGGVVDLSPWYEARYVIPLAGMIFANSMNGLSLAAERFVAETGRGIEFFAARRIAFQTAMLPTTNSFFAVGIVALPGMMTGQILSGISPLLAARYQIMVMAMVFSATGLTTALYLKWVRRRAGEGRAV